MGKRLFHYLSLVTALLLLFLIFDDNKAFPGSSPSVNDAAPYFSLKDMQGAELKLSELKGKVVLINFWASWCPQCRNEIPGFQKVYEAYKNRGFAIIAVDLDDVTPAALRQLRLTYPVVRADEKVVKDYGGIKGIPTSFLVGKDGKIIRKVRGEYPESSLRADLENALKK